MFVYLLLFILSFLFGAIGIQYKKFDKAGALIITLLMFLLCGFRDVDCGTDTINYYRIFFFNPEASDQRLEPLFILVRNCIPYFQLFLLFFSFGTYAIMYYVIQKEVRYSGIAVLIFMISSTKFFPESFNIIRQSFAASIILWGFVEWNQCNKMKTIVLFVIATLFHYSSILAFIFLPLKKINISLSVASIFVIASLFLGISGKSGVAVQNFVLRLGELNINPIITTYARYGFKVSGTMHFSSLILWLIPLSCFAIASYPKSQKAKKTYGYYYNVFLLATILGNLFIPALDWGLRMVFSLMIVQIIVIPDALRYAKRLQQILIFSSIILSSCSYLFYIYHLQYFNETSIVPYKSIL